MEISFLHTNGLGNAIPVRNEEISLCIFSINPLKIHHVSKKKKLKSKIPEEINAYVAE